MLNAIPQLEMQGLSSRTGRDMTGQDILKIIEKNYKPAIFSFWGWTIPRPYDSAVIKNVKKLLQNHLNTSLRDLDFFARLMVTFQPIFAQDKAVPIEGLNARGVHKSMDMSRNNNTRNVWSVILEKSGATIRLPWFMSICNSEMYYLDKCDLNFWKFVLKQNNEAPASTAHAEENVEIFNRWNKVLYCIFGTQDSKYFKLIKNMAFESENQHFLNCLNRKRCSKLTKFSQISARDSLHHSLSIPLPNMALSFLPLMRNIFLNKNLTSEEIDKSIDVALIVANFGQELQEVYSPSISGETEGKLINDLFANERQIIKNFDLARWKEWYQEDILKGKAEELVPRKKFNKEEFKKIQQSLEMFINNAKRSTINKKQSYNPKPVNQSEYTCPISGSPRIQVTKMLTGSSVANNPALTFKPIPKAEGKASEVKGTAQKVSSKAPGI